MKLIRLTNSLKHLIVDDEDYDRCRLYKWFLNISNERELNIRSTTDQIILSNFLMNDQFSEFDHADRDIYNNQKINLRKCKHKQNCMNRNKPATNHATSKYKGVDWSKEKRKWRSRIGTKHIGYFFTQSEAARAYNRLAKEIFGEFSCLNNL